MNEAAIAKTLSDACRDPSLLLAVSWQGPALQVQVTRLPESQPNWEALAKTWHFALLQLRLPEIQSVVFSSFVEGSEVIDWEHRLELVPPPQPPVSPQPEARASQLDLSSYCFTRNLRLLTADLKAPSEKIAKLVLFLHELSDADREKLLPVLDQCFKNPEGRLPPLPAPMQEQVEEIRGLEPEPWRRAGIWLSRYCYDPEKTMDQLRPVLDLRALTTAPAPPPVAPEPEPPPEPAPEVAPPEPVVLPERQRQILAIASHAAVWFFWGPLLVIVPLVILGKVQDKVVKGNALQALKFFLWTLLGSLLVALLGWLAFGTFQRPGLVVLFFVGVVFIGVVNVILPARAIVWGLKHPDRVFYYPFGKKLF